jgi:hypothetical protein
MNPDNRLARCRVLAFEAARLAHACRPAGPRGFRLETAHGGWFISDEEPWLQRVEPIHDETSQRCLVRAHVPVSGGLGPARWDRDTAEDFRGCLRRFVAERDLPMLLRFDVEMTVALSAVADSAGDLRTRVDRVTRRLADELSAVDATVTVEIFPGDEWTRRAARR